MNKTYFFVQLFYEEKNIENYNLTTETFQEPIEKKMRPKTAKKVSSSSRPMLSKSIAPIKNSFESEKSYSGTNT